MANRPKTQKEMFYNAHDKVMGMLKTYVEIQQGPNPLSREDLKKLIAKHPRYAILIPKS